MAPASTQEEMEDKYRNLFRSERLVYDLLANNLERYKVFIQEKLFGDSLTFGFGEAGVVPHSKEEMKDMLADIMKSCILAVMICIPPSEEDKAKWEASKKDSEKGDAASAPKEPELTPIGVIFLSGRANKPWMGPQTSIGMSIATEYQNKGYGRETLNWALDWAFRWGGMHRVHIGTASFNERAAHLYKSIGFVEEGRKREAAYLDFEYFDLIEMSMLVHEWKELRGIGKK